MNKLPNNYKPFTKRFDLAGYWFRRWERANERAKQHLFNLRFSETIIDVIETANYSMFRRLRKFKKLLSEQIRIKNIWRTYFVILAVIIFLFFKFK